MVRKAAFAALAALWLGGCAAGAPRYDVLIVGGTVYDGSGATLAGASIGINGDRIVTTGAGPDSTAGRTINADGLVVMPGFIDPHTHANLRAKAGQPAVNLNYLTQGVTTIFTGSDGRGVPGGQAMLAALEEHGSGVNVAFFAGHGQIRNAVIGMQNRPASDADIAAMQAELRRDMEAGAYGLSSGLYYAPGSYSATEEVVALAQVAAEFGGVYDTHLRDEGVYSIGVMAAVEEALRIAREAGIPLHISHIKVLGRDVWGMSGAVIGRIEEARANGVDVTANQYPWRASGTRFSSTLMPRWAMAADARDKIPDYEERLKTDMRANLERRGGAGAMLITAADSPYQGMTLEDAARAMGVDAVSAALSLVEAGDPSIASFIMHEDDVAAFAVQPWVMTGSDGSSGHPRLYASYPKAWQDLVRSGRISAGDFAYRSAGMAAETFGICGRSFLRPGYYADIVILDPDDYAPRATYADPTALTRGVIHLMLNGDLAIEDGELVNGRAGRVLRKSETTCSD